jgi:hypothetical protein
MREFPQAYAAIPEQSVKAGPARGLKNAEKNRGKSRRFSRKNYPEF